MTVLRRAVYTAATLILVDGARVASTGTITTTLTDANECLADMNVVREAASLPPLTKSKTPKISSDPQHELWKVVCDALLGKEIGTYKDKELPRGSYALFELGGATNPQCSAAVKDWGSALTSFPKEKPPGKGDVLLKGREGLAFVALYNPSNGAVGECKVVVCKEKFGEMQLRAQAADPKVPIERNEGDATPKTVSALFCSTFPDAFGNSPLFTQQQWDKIVKTRPSSASVAVPSFFAFAAMLAVLIMS
ncbi:hypothetical protein Emed_002564 [Eimeria media]